MAWTDPTIRETGHILTAAQWNSDITDNLAYLIAQVEPDSLTNSSGGTRSAGDVVVIDSSADSSFTTTTSADNELVFGVVMESINNGSAGRVAIAGIVSVSVTGSVSRGQFLSTSTTAAKAKANAAQSSATFAVALTGDSGGSCTALLGQSLAIGRATNIANDILYTTDGSAPSGYSEYTAARGRVIVGVPDGGTSAGTVGTAITDLASNVHTHDYSTVISHTHNLLGFQGGGGPAANFEYVWRTSVASLATITTGSSGSSTETTDQTSITIPYIQLMGIQKT